MLTTLALEIVWDEWLMEDQIILLPPSARILMILMILLTDGLSDNHDCGVRFLPPPSLVLDWDGDNYDFWMIWSDFFHPQFSFLDDDNFWWMIRSVFFHLLFPFLEIDNNDNWWKIRSDILHLLLSFLLDSFHASQPRSTSSGWVLAMLPLLLPIAALPSLWKWNITRWLVFRIPATLVLLSARFDAFSVPWKTLPLKNIAKGTTGWVHITSSYTNFDEISSSESHPTVN